MLRRPVSPLLRRDVIARNPKGGAIESWTGRSKFRRRRRTSRDSRVRIRNESAECRAARRALLEEEIELRRNIERAAAQGRALPPGGEVFATTVSGLKKTLSRSPISLTARRLWLPTVSCSGRSVSGPARCARISSTLGIPMPCDLEQHISLVVIARSPIERLRAWKRERGDLQILSRELPAHIRVLRIKYPSQIACDATVLSDNCGEPIQSIGYGNSA
jgi:hypothetical protein